MKKALYSVLSLLFLAMACNDNNSILEPENDYTQNTITKGRPILLDGSDQKIILADDYDIIIDEGDVADDLTIFTETKGRPILLDGGRIILSDQLDDLDLLNDELTDDLTINTLSKVGPGALNSDLVKVTSDNTVYSRNFTVNSKKGAVIFVKKQFLQPNGKPIFLRAQLIIPKDAFEGILNFNIEINSEDLSVKLSPSPYKFDRPLLLSVHFSGVDLTGYSKSELDFDYMDGEPEHLSYCMKDVDITRGQLLVVGAEIHHFSRYGWTRTR